MPVDSRPFTFLQLSDVHLDSKFASSRLSLPATKRQERSQELRQTFKKALEIAQERGVEAILIPGDLFDGESITSRTVNELIEAILQVPDIPILIAPGNHDYLSADSLYNRQCLKSRGIRPWPDNVHIFSRPEFTTFKHPRRSEVSFTGRAFTGNVPVSERLLGGEVPTDPKAAINLLLFHGSLDGYSGGDSHWPGKRTAPFSASELNALGFNYAAVGHYHHYTEIRQNGGPLLGAYSGCLVGRNPDESGPRFAIRGSVRPYEPEASIETVELDKRRIIVSGADITGLTAEAVLKEIEANLQVGGARTGLDVVCLKLLGRHPTGAEPHYVKEKLQDKYYHLSVQDETRPDYLSEKFDKRTTEGKFIQTMLDMKKKAEASPETADDTTYGVKLTAGMIEDALYYGLDALKQKRVTVRDVD